MNQGFTFELIIKLLTIRNGNQEKFSQLKSLY